MAKLTPKQELFIQYYMISLNATEAALKAGYSKNRAKEIGYQLLHKPTLSAIINDRLQNRATDNGVTADMVLKDLIDLKDKCLGRKPVTVTYYDMDGNRNDSEKLVFDSSGAKASLELLGKHLKLFTDKVETENTNLNYDMSNLTDAELEAEIERLKG